MISNLRAIALWSFFIGVTCARGAQSTPVSISATSCFLIAPRDQTGSPTFDYGRRLIPRFDKFAAAAELTRSGSENSGGQFAYRKPAEGVYVSLTFGMGGQRAEAALYSDWRGTCTTCKEFEEFMTRDVGTDFTVMRCAEVEGYRPPELWNVDLRKP